MYLPLQSTAARKPITRQQPPTSSTGASIGNSRKEAEQNHVDVHAASMLPMLYEGVVVYLRSLTAPAPSLQSE